MVGRRAGGRGDPPGRLVAGAGSSAGLDREPGRDALVAARSVRGGLGGRGGLLVHIQFRGSKDLLFTILSFRFAPELMVIISLYVIYQKLGLFDSYIGMIWVMQLVTIPMIVWITSRPRLQQGS